MNREYFLNLKIKKDEQTNIICPHCKDGRLLPDKETLKLKAGMILEFLDEEEVDHIFSILLCCENQKCRSAVSCGGIARVCRVLRSYSNDWYYDEVLHPHWFFPAINIFDLPDDCPESISVEIINSFSLFFNDPIGSCVHIRIALERFMDEESIPQEIKSTGKATRLNLHDRILKYREKERELASNIMAIKWLGNDASHQGTLVKDDVLDGYEVMQYVLNERYEMRVKREKIREKAFDIEKKI